MSERGSFGITIYLHGVWHGCILNHLIFGAGQDIGQPDIVLAPLEANQDFSCDPQAILAGGCDFSHESHDFMFVSFASGLFEDDGFGAGQDSQFDVVPWSSGLVVHNGINHGRHGTSVGLYFTLGIEATVVLRPCSDFSYDPCGQVRDLLFSEVAELPLIEIFSTEVSDLIDQSSAQMFLDVLDPWKRLFGGSRQIQIDLALAVVRLSGLDLGVGCTLVSVFPARFS